MANPKIERKIRFYPLFPYGFCSKDALMITGRRNPYVTMLRLGDNPEAILKEVGSYRKNTINKINTMQKQGMIRTTQLACGKPARKRVFAAITKAGLNALAETPDFARTADNDTSLAYNGKIKGTYYENTSEVYNNLRNMLYDMAPTPDSPEDPAFNNTLLQAVIQERLSPLSAGIHLADQVKINLTRYSQNQIYDIWRTSHIQAMFLANDHLTYLDRRPYDTAFSIDGICDEESLREHINKHELTMAAFCYMTLNKWYRSNPDFYQLTKHEPDATPYAYNEWLNTPCYYRMTELPETEDPAVKKLRDDNLQGSQKRAHNISLGLAAGRNANYVVYHTRPNTFNWVYKREQDTKRKYEEAVRHIKTQYPEIAYADTVDFALYFCPTIYQFRNFFVQTFEKHKPGQKLNHATNKPYASIHAIPINDAGTFLLWCLMEYSPLETEYTIRSNLVEEDPAFQHAVDQYFPLTYHGKRVFLGHTMDIAKINYAIEEHLDGKDFYICCFPEQAPWYANLFPGKTFL